MISDAVQVPLKNLSQLFIAVFALGLLLTLPLYKFNVKKFVHSTLFIKIMMWWPIFAIFIATLYLGFYGRMMFVSFLALMAYRDLRRTHIRPQYKRLTYAYFTIFVFALFHFCLFGLIFPDTATEVLITICFASVIADVTAFFLGNYAGKHKLPAALNSNKSWEGVSGQIIGALLGVMLIRHFVHIELSILLFIPIGVGSAAGDLINSYVKRKLGIREWSNSIPGHGGYLDRLSSLGGSLLLTFYWLVIIAVL